MECINCDVHRFVQCCIHCIHIIANMDNKEDVIWVRLVSVQCACVNLLIHR